MSLDLLKEFGYYKEDNPQENPWATETSQISGPSQPADDDDFGDFEAPILPNQATFKPSNSTLLSEEIPSRISELHVAGPGGPKQEENASNKVDIDDDWGDFNDGFQAAVRGPSISGAVPEASHDIGSQHLKGETLTTSTIDPPTRSSDESSKVPPRFSSTKSQQAHIPFPTTTQPPDPPNVNSSPNPLHPTSTTPPTNIPPPSTLLHLIATILQTLPLELKALLNTPQPHLSSSAKPSHPFSSTASQSPHPSYPLHIHISHLRASARILAGRKHRWKRDTLLSQNMSIAPSQPGKTGGMKLTSLDRAEARREDGVAAEVLRTWRAEVGRVRAAVASLSSRNRDGKDGVGKGERGFILPEFSENMHIRIASPAEGALKAPKQCPLCGLRREERVVGVDGEVEDSFGEWWVEYWGHWDCWRWWGDFEGGLGGRR